MEYFGEGVRPHEVYISATVDPASAIASACSHLGINTILCRGKRLNSAVMRALGIDGNVNACKNVAMKGLVGKCTALLKTFSHSSLNNDALRNYATDKQKEVEELLHCTDRLGVEATEQAGPGKLPDTRCALGKYPCCDRGSIFRAYTVQNDGAS